MTSLRGVDSWEKALLLSRFALEKKAYDLVLMEVRGITSIADYFIICSGRSDRQVQSIAQGIGENLGAMGTRPLAVEGMSRGQWVLMDFADVIVHIFYQPVREFYDLEGLWGHAPRVELPEPYSTLASQFRIRAEEQL
ncbi:MAG: ribosome silencing factor [Deltaproteobacteria bacterium RIFCSPHIGHO2_02_FULL_60_17]|nr:MAG: ribosome silencing factor [Deltaproteobacteria bacterium RIFCSPHIGHO2_02_FULL_60_17]OGQ76817.1 MAG: ribosome silencing factor [Deltaproteobacteria bacterium RIFCSPLOWO2_12_FULL_60_16]